MSKYGIQFVMQGKLVKKLAKAGATSSEKAIMIEEAGFDDVEEHWLNYFAGDFLGKIKKTETNRYYIGNLYSPDY